MPNNVSILRVSFGFQPFQLAWTNADMDGVVVLFRYQNICTVTDLIICSTYFSTNLKSDKYNDVFTNLIKLHKFGCIASNPNAYLFARDTLSHSNIS